MEEGRRIPVLFDASAYMLFEASGDSEAQYFDGGASEPDSDAPAPAEDDAQSCSCGSFLVSGSAGLRHEVDADGSRGADLDDFSGEEKDDDDDGGCSDEDDGVVDQRTAAAVAAKEKKPMKSKGCDQGSNVKMMNESEGDRLFWEACLAS